MPAHTELYLRPVHVVDSAHAKVGDHVAAILESPVVIDGRDAIPAGTEFQLRVTNSHVAQGKGDQGLLTFEVDSFSFNGQKQPIQATALSEQTKPMPRPASPKSLAPDLPVREDQAEANARVDSQRILSFVTTQAFRFRP